jgi:hypothetical protein
VAKQATSDAATALLTSTLSDLVVEMVEAKCAKITPRERATLERRIDKAVTLFVKGMQLSPAQRRADQEREHLRAKEH